MQSQKSLGTTYQKKIFTLLSGSVGAQAILVIASPILTRLYSPTDFGAVAVFNAVLGVLLVVSTLRLELALPIPESEHDSNKLIIISTFTTLILSLIVLVISLLYQDAISRTLGVIELGPYIWLISPAIILTSFFQIYYYYCIRHQLYKAIARLSLLNSLTSVLIQLAGEKLGLISLIIGQTAGRGVGGIRLIKNVKPIILKNTSLSEYLQILKEYKQYPFYSLPAALFKQLSLHSVALILASFFGPVAAGLYALAYRVLITPLMTLGRAVGNVFLGRAPDAYRGGELGVLVAKATWALVLISVPSSIVVTPFLPTLFTIIFGAEWIEAGVVSQVLAPWLCFYFISSPLSSAMQIIDRQNEYFYFQMSSFLLQITALASGVFMDSYDLAIALYSITAALLNIALIIWIHVKAEYSPLVFFKALSASTLVGLLLIAPAFSAEYFFGFSYSDLRLILLSLFLLAGYLFLLLRRGYFLPESLKRLAI